MSDYADSKYMTSIAKIYARYKAKDVGIIDLPTIYVTESDFVAQTDFSSESLMATFPFDDKAKLALDEDFKQRFPEIDAKITEIVKNSKNETNTTEIKEDKEEPAALSPSESDDEGGWMTVDELIEKRGAERDGHV